MVLLSIKSIKGKRDYMEDRYVYIEKQDIKIGLICDGHGGYELAEKTIKKLPKKIIKNLINIQDTNIRIAYIIRNILIEWGNKHKMIKSGTTLTGIIMKGDIIYIVNIGDSRTTIKLKNGSFVYKLKPIFNENGEYIEKLIINYNKTNFFSTEDHNLENIEEINRIHNSGGVIIDGRLNGIINLSRTIGDSDVKKGLTYVPDIYWIKKSVINGPIIMYSDGLYELEGNVYDIKDKILQFNKYYLYKLGEETNAEELVNYAYKNGSEDNLTVMIIKL